MRTILHINSHTYRGVKIQPYGLGYTATMGKVFLFACSWVKVEKLIDENKAKKVK